MKRWLIFLLITLSSVSMLRAQKLWTLQNCIDYALANNIQIKQQKLSENLAAVNLWESKAALFPNLGAYASQAYNNGKTIDMFTNQFATSTVQSDNFYLSTSVTLFSGFQLLNSVKQSRINLQSNKYDLDKMMNDISLNLATAYLQILYNIELLNNAESQVKVTKLQVARTQKLVDAGTSAKGPLLNLQAQAATEDVTVVTAKNNLDLSYLTLKQMLDLGATDTFDIDIPVLAVPTEATLLTKPDAIYALALTTRPEIKSAELQLQSSQLGLSIAHGLRSPILSLRASYGTGYSGASKRLKSYQYSGLDTVGYTFQSNPIPVVVPGFDYQYETIPFKNQFNDNMNKSISLTLTIPIFDNLKTMATISKAKIGITSAEYTLQTAKNTLYKSIEQAYEDATAALNKYNSSLKSVEALKESFKYTEQKFDVGMVTTTDYDASKNSLEEAESNLLQAKYEYVFRLKVIDFYMGKPIELK